jgi:hypothetical protein
VTSSVAGARAAVQRLDVLQHVLDPHAGIVTFLAVSA